MNLFYLFALVAVGGLLYSLVSLVIARQRLAQKALPQAEQYPGVSILKPLKGLDDRLEENLRSFFELSYPKYELLFGVSDASDPAVAVVRNLCEEFPAVPTRLVFGKNESLYNPKVNNLQNMYAFARHDYIMISDSNTSVRPDMLQRLMDHMMQPGMGLVTATIRGSGAKNIASVFENLHLNAFLMPNVFAVNKLFGITLAIGKCMVLKKETLDRLGGFFALRSYLAEDYMLARKIRGLGLKVEATPLILDTINEKWAFDRFMNRHSRWAKMRRTINPLHYVVESCSNPVSAAFLAAVVSFSTAGVLFFAATAVAKMLIDGMAARLIDSDLRWYHMLWTVPKDLLIGLLWFVPLFDTTVDWRGNRFKLLRDSQLMPLVREGRS